MSRKISAALASFINGEGAVTEAFHGGVLIYYTGSQPATADAAATGTGLCMFTNSSGVWTREVRGTTVIGLASVSANPSALTVGGINVVPSLASLPAFTTATQLAIDLAALVNSTRTYPNWYATVSTTNVTLTAPKNSDTFLNGLTVICTAAGTATINGGSSTTFGGAGATAGVADVNGLDLGYPAAAGVALKNGAWTAVGGTDKSLAAAQITGSPARSFAGFTSGTQTAGWFRFYATPSDPEILGTPTLDTTAAYLRMDGTIATSGGDITATGGTTITWNATHTENSFTLTVPQSQS